MKKQILKLIPMLFFLIAPLCVSAFTVSPYQKYALMNYTNASSAQLSWMNQNFALKVGGNNPNNPEMKWMGYYDILGIGSIAEYLRLQEWANSNSVSVEDVLMHAKINYTSTISTVWSGMDKFDAFENANGVLLETSPGVFSDKTTVAYSGASPYTTINSNIYIGYELPFDQVNFNIRTAASNLNGTWQYWNGSSWATLPLTSDGTSIMIQSGQILFVPPSDWARTIVNGSRDKYFIRFEYVSAATNPVINTIKGDNWINDGISSHVRGWDPTSGSIVNSGELAYNPTPPAGASAKFIYQARIPFWSANQYVANPADFQVIGGTSKRTWSEFLAYRTTQMVVDNGYTGIMGDDGASNDSFKGITSADTDFVDKTSNSWTVENADKYSELVDTFHALNPGVLFGLNGQVKSLVNYGDWSLAEYHTFNYKTASPRCITVGDGSTTNMCYDDYLPANNPTNKFGLLIYDDTLSTVATVPWDRSNRGPIVALSKHLIAANENTYFSYYTRGGYIYDETDNVVLNDNSVVRLASQPIPNLAEVKRWGTWFPAMGVDMGIPDVNGWNSGVRSLAWKTWSQIGGDSSSSGDVWRRDYTNAIVLHRPAMYNTTATQYTTPSSLIDLGGTYYPLYADGTTGAGITNIALKSGEGAILMKSPLGNDTVAPAAPSGLNVS